MSRLLLVRHAKAEQPRPGESDVGRVLSARGRADAQVAVPLLAARALTGSMTVLVSPAVRTQETYAILRAGLAPHHRIDEPRLYEAGVATIVDLAARQADDDVVMIIGHNPTMRDALAHLSGVDVPRFPTCGIADLTGPLSAGGSASLRLEELLVPRAEGDGLAAGS